MNKSKLISEKYVKSHSTLLNDIDNSAITDSIIDAQNINFKHLLPKELYDDIFTQYDAYGEYKEGGGTDPIDTQIDARLIELVAESKPVIKFYSIFHSLLFLYAKIDNKGINHQTSNYSQSVDIQVVEKLEEKIKDKAEAAAANLLEFLADNREVYPEYTESCETNIIEDAYSVDLYLGKNI